MVMGVPSDADLEAIAEALRRLGVAKRVRRRRASIAVDFGGGEPVDVLVVGMNTVRPGVSSRLESGRPLIVVADRVPAAMRAELDAADAGWLDRRGHLKFHHDGVWIDTEIPPAPTTPHGQTRNPLAGPVARSIGFAALVANPSPLPAIRELARRLEASPAGVSQAVGRLTEAGLLTHNRRATVTRTVLDSYRRVGTRMATAHRRSTTSARSHRGRHPRHERARSTELSRRGASRLSLLAADSSVLRRLARSSSGETSTRDAPARVALSPSRAAFARDDTPPVVVKGHPVAPVRGGSGVDRLRSSARYGDRRAMGASRPCLVRSSSPKATHEPWSPRSSTWPATTSPHRRPGRDGPPPRSAPRHRRLSSCRPAIVAMRSFPSHSPSCRCPAGVTWVWLFWGGACGVRVTPLA